MNTCCRFYEWKKKFQLDHYTHKHIHEFLLLEESGSLVLIKIHILLYRLSKQKWIHLYHQFDPLNLRNTIFFEHSFYLLNICFKRLAWLYLEVMIMLPHFTFLPSQYLRNHIFVAYLWYDLCIWLTMISLESFLLVDIPITL